MRIALLALAAWAAVVSLLDTATAQQQPQSQRADRTREREGGAGTQITSPETRPQPSAGDWRLLATRQVDLSKGSIDVDLARATGSYKAIRIAVGEAPITLTEVTVVYADGTRHVEARRINLRPGDRTRPINRTSDARSIRSVVLIYEKAADAPISPVVGVMGLVGDDVGRLRPASLPKKDHVPIHNMPTAAAAPPAPMGMPTTAAPPPASQPTVLTPASGGTRGPIRPGAPVAPVDTVVPEFPWPPPKVSGRLEISRHLLVPAGDTNPTLGRVVQRLQAALNRAGYGDQSFYRIRQDGVAVVTRLERILPDGRPDPDPRQRWRPPTEREPFSLTRFVGGLLFTRPGNYRVIVFSLSSEAPTSSSQSVTGSQATGWVGAGAARLPRWLAEQPYSSDHSAFALIYEFEKADPEASAVHLDPSRLSALQHLEKAAIWPALARP